MKKNFLKPVFAIALICSVAYVSCKDKDEEPQPEPEVPTVACSPATSFNAGTAIGPRLVFKFKFDSTQVRLDNFGNPATIPAGRAGQSPKFNFISQHYIELANDLDAVGGGKVLHIGTQTTAGGVSAIDYCASTMTAENITCFSKPLSQITPGSYKWLRVSLAYQNYDIVYKANAIPGNHLGTGTIASFVGFNTYVNGYQINGTSYLPSSAAGGPGNHLQGYWAFETNVLATKYFYDGQAPAGATTVPNPFISSPIPSGSCLVTGQFVDNAMVNAPLVITGAENQDIVITISLSSNKSFEWTEVVADGFYQPELGEAVLDMGLRGLIPIKN